MEWLVGHDNDRNSALSHTSATTNSLKKDISNKQTMNLRPFGYPVATDSNLMKGVVHRLALPLNKAPVTITGRSINHAKLNQPFPDRRRRKVREHCNQLTNFGLFARKGERGGWMVVNNDVVESPAVHDER